MATQSLYSLHPVPLSPSSSKTAIATHYYSLPTKPQRQTPPPPPTVASHSRTCCSCRIPKAKGIQPTRLFIQQVLLFTGFASDSLLELELDTQTLLATISVLAAISLSLFLGLKVTFLSLSLPVFASSSWVLWVFSIFLSFCFAGRSCAVSAMRRQW